jgi:hypothetical protein
VVERPVLHHQHNEGVHREVAGAGQVHPALLARGLRHQHVGVEHRAQRGRRTSTHRQALEEVTPPERLVGLLLLEPFGVLAIAHVLHRANRNRSAATQVSLGG